MEAGIFESYKEEDTVDVESFQGMCAFSSLFSYPLVKSIGLTVNQDLYI